MKFENTRNMGTCDNVFLNYSCLEELRNFDFLIRCSRYTDNWKTFNSSFEVFISSPLTRSQLNPQKKSNYSFSSREGSGKRNHFFKKSFYISETTLVRHLNQVSFERKNSPLYLIRYAEGSYSSRFSTSKIQYLTSPSFQLL